MSRLPTYSDSHADALAEGRRNGRSSLHGLNDLLRWFVTGFRAEVPDRLHDFDVWRDAKRRDDPAGYQPVGGSLMGTPRTSDPFRAYLEDSPFAEEVAEYDGHEMLDKHFARPMRAALARLAGRGANHEERPFMARALFRTALRDGDWDSACASMGIPEPVRGPYIEAALWRLYRLYDIEPAARPLRRPA